MLTLTEQERRAYMANQKDLADALARLDDVRRATANLLDAIDSMPDLDEAASRLRNIWEGDE